METQGLEIDDALRVYLSHFSLPGESQQIERIVSAFSGSYRKHNTTKFCENSVYLLVYSLLMLQTDAHNINVERKMNIEDFLNMAKNIKVNETDNIDPTYLAMLYSSVTENPLSVHFTAKRKAEM